MTADSIWRDGATAEELAEIASLDEERLSLERRSKALAARRYLIANRACQRQRARLRAEKAC